MQLLTLKEVGAALRKSVRGIRKDIASGRFGPDLLRLGRNVRVRADELAGWIAAGCPARETWLAVRGAGGVKRAAQA
ncbi:MAG: hypothetical protein IPM13_05410 [Phycisphaerales bacterium]|nr:hypothetical protein [Phycisphaerales bacterium]